MSLNNIFSMVAGLEDDSEIQDTVVATAEEAAEAIVSEEIAVVEAEVEKQTAEVAAAEVRIDVVEEKIEELAEEIDGVESMLSGSTPFNAGLVEYRFNRAVGIANRFSNEKAELMGSESFADASTAQMNTLAGLESMKETLIKAGEKVKKFFIELYKSFIAVITGLFDRLKGLEKKAGVIKAAVNSKEKFKDKVKVPGLLDPRGEAKGVVDAVIKASASVSKNLTQLGSVSTRDAVSTAVSAIVDELAKSGTKSVKSSDVNTETLEVKINSATLTLVSPKTDDGVSDASFKLDTGKTDDKEVAALTKGQLITICNSVAADAAKLRPAKLDAKALAATRDQAIAALAKQAAEEDTGKDEKKKLIGYIRSGHRASLKLTSGALKLGSNVLASQLSFVKAHY